MPSPEAQALLADIAEHLAVAPDAIKPETSFVDDLNADSLDLVELGMLIEERFDLEIPQEQYGALRTLGDAMQYIRDRLGYDPFAES